MTWIIILLLILGAFAAVCLRIEARTWRDKPAEPSLAHRWKAMGGGQPTTGQRSVLVANGEDAVVSADRTRVAYVRDLDLHSCVYRDPLGVCWAFNDLLTADLSGTDERAVAHTADMINRFSPDWSLKGPGSRSPGRPLTKGGVWPGVRPDGSGLETLELYAGRGRFSPDGRKIASVRVGDIKLMNVADRRTRLLTSDASSDGYAPDWSPDGTRIAYTGSGGLYLPTVKIGEVRNLAGWTAPVSTPSTAVFSPDGTDWVQLRPTG